MKIRSLTGRLILFSSVWAVIVVFAAGLVLTELFRQSAEESFDNRLNIVLKILVGELAVQLGEPGELTPPASLGEPRFELPLSGWYWTVSEANKFDILLSSESLLGGVITIDEETSILTNKGTRRQAYGLGPDKKRLRILERRIRFTEGKGYDIRVTGNAEELERNVAAFRQKARLVMGFAGVITLAAILLLVRAGLRPLYKMQERLRAVAQGDAERIEGQYPTEIAGLVKETNALIHSNKDTLERARTQVGNLAHALKTPLSVMVNETRSVKGPINERMLEQTDVMRDQIQLYLERARMAARRNVMGTVTPIALPISRLVKVMDKIHTNCDVALHMPQTDELRFRGEEHDLEEVTGNLLDNACKWAQSNVVVTCAAGRDHSGTINAESRRDEQNEWLSITIEDDGPGLTEEQLKLARKRGQRLDESKPGSGLGLSIVEELIGLYHGQIHFTRSELGGLKVVLHLPAI